MRLIYTNSVDHNSIKSAKDLSKNSIERDIIIKKRINSGFYSKSEIVEIVAEKLLRVISQIPK